MNDRLPYIVFKLDSRHPVVFVHIEEAIALLTADYEAHLNRSGSDHYNYVDKTVRSTGTGLLEIELRPHLQGSDDAARGFDTADIVGKWGQRINAVIADQLTGADHALSALKLVRQLVATIANTENARLRVEAAIDDPSQRGLADKILRRGPRQTTATFEFTGEEAGRALDHVEVQISAWWASKKGEEARMIEGLTLRAREVWNEDVRLLSRRLMEEAPIDRGAYEASCAAALPKMADLPLGPQVDYLEVHKERFYEMDNVASLLLSASGGRSLLDVGMSINTVMLPTLLDGAQVKVLDRLDLRLGPNSQYPLFNCDLNDPELDQQDVGERFDVILFAEILEHLTANPVRVLRFFINHLNDGGFLFLTTPNFFARENIEQMTRMKNPQPVFSAAFNREEANQYHVREYAMYELIEFALEAGGKISAFFYSDCWDEGPDKPPLSQRSNLCIVVSPHREDMEPA